MKFFILNGPTASGKTAIMEYLLIENNDYLEPIISFTTRQPRTSERHGREYYFISPDDYVNLRKDNRIIEESKYLDWHYGVTTGELDRVESTRKNGIAIMNLYGIRKMKRAVGYQKVISIFVYRDLSEIIRSMKDLNVSENEINHRINNAKQEMREISGCDHVIYNTGSLAEATAQLVAIIKNEINSRPTERDILPGQKYRHFSGESCEIITELAEHSETVSPMVVYRSLKTGLLYTRPYELFCGKKQMPPNRGGAMVNRFELID